MQQRTIRAPSYAITGHSSSTPVSPFIYSISSRILESGEETEITWSCLLGMSSPCYVWSWSYIEDYHDKFTTKEIQLMMHNIPFTCLESPPSPSDAPPANASVPACVPHHFIDVAHPDPDLTWPQQLLLNVVSVFNKTSPVLDGSKTVPFII